MSDGIGKLRLQSRLQPKGKTPWLIIEELAAADEAELLRLLRPHAEMRFSDDQQGKDDADRRRRLDAALGTLTMLEIAHQVGVAEGESAPQVENLKKLFQSEAFLRYVNAYLYFGIRFLAWRITPPKWTDPQITAKGERSLDSNQRPFPLITPPHTAKDDRVDPDTRFAELNDLATACDPATNPKDSTAEVEALTFLDGFTNDLPDDSNVLSEPERFELWLRGLYPDLPGDEQKRTPDDQKRFLDDQRRFPAIRQGLIDWAIARRDFYLSLQSEEATRPRPVGGWAVTNPLAARFALADIYWISRVLRAEVSANASVTYTRSNWLKLLRFRALLDGDGKETEGKPGGKESDSRSELEKAEEVLRSVFDFVCDLVQNAVEITEEKEKQFYEPELFCSPPATTAKWRKVFDEELEEIQQQRDRREFSKEKSQTEVASPPTSGVAGNKNPTGPSDDDWMARIRTEKKMHNLIGLSFSGGGIRSATFNLGVLQGLQEFDLLRKIDFLSTVSGGGFIGSWLVANVCRTKHWLGRLMNWEDSIDHLRSYSNYLAPRLGMLSADTWSMWASWARNAFLIQLTCLAWLWAALLIALEGQSVFLKSRHANAVLFAALMMTLVLLTLLYNLWGNRALNGNPFVPQRKADTGPPRRDWRPSSAFWVWGLAIVPIWCFCFVLASLLWAHATKPITLKDAIQHVQTFSVISRRFIYVWLSGIWIALAVIAFFTLSRRRDQTRLHKWGWRFAHAAWISLFCVGVLGLELGGILWLFVRWSEGSDQFSWYAYVLGHPWCSLLTPLALFCS